MVYIGSKTRIAKDLLNIIKLFKEDEEVYIEPFVGGCNMIDKVDDIIHFNKKIGNDYNVYLIEFLKQTQNNREDLIQYNFITKEEYDFFRKEYRKHLKDNKYECDLAKIGYVGVLASFRGGFYDFGYAGKTKPKKENSKERNYIKEKFNNFIKQKPKLKDIEFNSVSYNEFMYEKYKDNCIIYCDIPYKGTKEYGNTFNHTDYWEWCRNMSLNGYKIFTSELQAPDDFISIYSKGLNASVCDKTFDMTENLFIHKSLYKKYKNVLDLSKDEETIEYNFEDW